MGKKSKRRNPSSKKNKSGNAKGKSQANNGSPLLSDKGGEEWTKYDECLDGQRDYYGYDYDDDEVVLGVKAEDEAEGLTNKLADLSIKNGADGGMTTTPPKPKYPKGSEEALRAALRQAWSTDASISNPEGVGLAMGPKNNWLHWAIPMASYPECLENFWIEYKKDMDMHQNILDKLSKGMKDGTCECQDYIMALNCIFQHTFDNVSMDNPPSLNLQEGMMFMNLERMRNGLNQQEQEPVYVSHMKMWNGYVNRAFKLMIMKIVDEHALIPRPESSEYHTEISPLKYRGEFPSAKRRQEIKREIWGSDCSDEDEYGGSAFGGACGFSGADVEDLLAQGVKPWDDDAGAVLAALNGECGYDY